MPREDPKLFAIYEDPCDRIPTPGTEAARIRDLRAQIEATRLAIIERDELLAEAAHVLTSARDKAAHSQVTEAVEIVECARIDRLIKKHKNITAELEMQVKAVETEMEDLTRAIEKREKVVEALEEERENLRKKIKGLLDKQTSLEQQIEGLTIEEKGGFEE